MAAKPSTANQTMNSDPRIAPKELIVTRHKSAQLKRQLRSGDRSMKRLTQLLKSPERSKHLTVNKSNGPSLKTYKNATVKQKNSPKSPKLLAAQRASLHKSPRKRKVSEKVDNKEFHPNKLKRKISSKRIMLKPKHELTKVHSLNKRKWTTPRKDPSTIPTLEPTPPPDPRTEKIQSQTMTVGELVNICDDEDSLTNEDLIEILTCPSPVWWEDPPDGRYSEDPIPTNLLDQKASCKRIISSEEFSMVENAPTVVPQIPAPEESTENSIKIAQKAKLMEEKLAPVDVKIELTKKDDKFIKKRSTLENILSGIKTKSTSNKHSSQSNKFSNTNAAESQVSKIASTSAKFDSIEQVLRDNSEMLKKSLQKHKPSILKTEARHKEELVDESTDPNTQGSSNDDIFAEMREDDILNDLENLEIPIETTNASGEQKSTVNEPGDYIILDDDLSITGNFLDKSEMLPEDSMKATLVEGSDELTFSEQYQTYFVPPSAFSAAKTTVWSRKYDKNRDKTKDTANESKAVPENMPPLKKYSKLTETKMASPGNSKFESSESDFESSSVVSGQDVDTISDTNVKYLNDDQISDYEGDKLKPKTEVDDRLGVGEDDKCSSNKNQETFIVSEEKEEFLLKEEGSESNKHKPDETVENNANESSNHKSDATDLEEQECKKDCIIVYKIIETISESNEDLDNDEFCVKTKPKRVVRAKRLSNSPKSLTINPDQHSSVNNINDFFKKCKRAYIKAPNVRRTKCKVQKLNKAANKRRNAINVIKKGCEGESVNNQLTEDKKSIAVTDTKTVNYCLKCSSIFDTKVCNYCVMKT